MEIIILTNYLYKVKIFDSQNKFIKLKFVLVISKSNNYSFFCAGTRHIFRNPPNKLIYKTDVLTL